MNDTTARIISQLDQNNAEYFTSIFGTDVAEILGEDYEIAIQSAIDALCDGDFRCSACIYDDEKEKVERLVSALVDLKKAVV